MHEQENAEERAWSDEEVEQLLQANERLQGQLSAAQQQSASLSVLSSNLAAQQAGDALVSFGEGSTKKWVNARSVRLLSLQAEMSMDMEALRTEPSGLYTVLVDELPVVANLPEAEAEQWLDEVADVLNRAMRPPRK